MVRHGPAKPWGISSILIGTSKRKVDDIVNLRLTKINLDTYLKETYGTRLFYQYGGKVLENVKPLIQDEYGEDNDCSLISILTAIKAKKPEIDLEYFYDLIERIAKRYFYKGTFGTLPCFIKPIMKRIIPYDASVRYIKGIGFNFHTIKKQIDYNNPVILSVVNDGRDVYKNHSVVIIGYTAYKIDDTMVYVLAVYDNWRKEISYIDYNKLSILSSINYYAPVAQQDRATDF